ncbi:hypothetical protein F2Q69_00061498 [Brassica cretica]|uniref:Uncharacterized protein n=1 Tax=Brassica cretica TaxID=69181 RepID=A0A8S9RQE8_BRACR|nr:hypothetical protein F2Q69_00061498 [Brassica cretica]
MEETEENRSARSSSGERDKSEALLRSHGCPALPQGPTRIWSVPFISPAVQVYNYYSRVRLLTARRSRCGKKKHGGDDQNNRI